MHRLALRVLHGGAVKEHHVIAERGNIARHSGVTRHAGEAAGHHDHGALALRRRKFLLRENQSGRSSCGSRGKYREIAAERDHRERPPVQAEYAKPRRGWQELFSLKFAAGGVQVSDRVNLERPYCTAGLLTGCSAGLQTRTDLGAITNSRGQSASRSYAFLALPAPARKTARTAEPPGSRRSAFAPSCARLRAWR